MPIIVKDSGSKDFEPAPEGLHAAICVDIVDKGMVTGQFGTKHKLELRWQLDGHSEAGLRDDGKQWLVVRQLTASLHEKAALRQLLESWRGKKFTAEELAGFDVENVLGAPCMLQIFHNKAENGKVFANVQNIMPLPKGMPRPIASEYVRVVDRGAPDGVAAPEYYDDEEPF